MPKSATLKHRGIKIVPVKVTRYEVRHLDGRKLKTFASTSAARAWIDGYLKALSLYNSDTKDHKS